VGGARLEGWGSGSNFATRQLKRLEILSGMMPSYALHSHVTLKNPSTPCGENIILGCAWIKYQKCGSSRTRCVRSGVRLLVFHVGTWGFSLGEAKSRNLYTS